MRRIGSSPVALNYDGTKYEEGTHRIRATRTIPPDGVELVSHCRDYAEIACSAGLVPAEEPPRKVEAISGELASMLDGARTAAENSS